MFRTRLRWRFPGRRLGDQRYRKQGDAEVSGSRPVASGTVVNEGSLGFYWSASPSGATNGLYQGFHSGGVSPQHNGNRGYGFPCAASKDLPCTERTFVLVGADVQAGISRQAASQSELQEARDAKTSGSRNVGSGVVVQEGSGGFSWSASPGIAAFGRRLQFDGATVSSQSSTDRGYGFPLRCIQGFTLRGANRCSRQSGGTERQEGMTAETSGYRNVSSGAMVFESGNGYSWSASPSSAPGGLSLIFGSGFVYSLADYTDRGFGFPLRCIQGFALYGWNRCLDRSGVARKDDNRGLGLPQRRLGRDDQRGLLR